MPRTPKASDLNPHPLAIEHLPPTRLIPDPRNARKHDKKQIVKVGAVIDRFGFLVPIIVDEHENVISGHARLQAALDRKLPTVPCVRKNGLSASGRTALAIAENKLSDLSTFDPDMLSELLRELEQDGFDLELTAFDTAEIDILFDESSLAPTQADPADAFDGPDVTTPAVSRLGDLWNLGDHRLLCGDALDPTSYQTLLGSELADIALTDMPYNVSIPNHASGLGKARHAEFAMASGEMTPPEFIAFMRKAMTNMVAHTIDGSIHYHFMDWRHTREILEAGAGTYAELKSICTWDKGSGGMGSLYRSQHEFVFVFKNGSKPHVNNIQLGKHGRYRTTIWSYPSLNSFGKGRAEQLAAHPTVKPVSLVADALRDCSKRGALVLDPFAGSGTTLIAAERTKRRARAIELDPHYVDTAIRRWQASTGGTATLAESGTPFADLTAVRS